ncbi:ABC transporter permease [Pseudoalteromonas sp. SCSIO 43201]|uniref:ABC transporter permease n=1 Tax=Pseudoalteromonas sp. SCSIO 43201 TaxID=2822842 RepID=UPI002075DA25|nr:ABC transporter permease [Pseudoalteromonas sp. SCSIO 43201]USD28466.1 ABC transporter permease [Pseudoalteromonas sp. SCSIO 43201]
MIIANLHTALRVAKKQKLHFILNVLGFSIGVSAALLILLYTLHELSFDTFQPNAERVVRAEADFSSLGLGTVPTINYPRLLEAKDLTQVEDIFALFKAKNHDPALGYVSAGENQFQLNNLYVASSNILDFIDLKVLDGNIELALSTPEQLVLSRSEAMRLFGRVDVVGQRLHYQYGVYTVAAVFEDLPLNTHFAFDSLIHSKKTSENLYMHMHYVYLRLNTMVDIATLADEITELFVMEGERGILSVNLAPLADLHLYHDALSEMRSGGNPQAIIASIILSIALLCVAAINFINLSIAQSGSRIKEVGIRKSLGASSGQLFWQFLCEYLLIAIVTCIIGAAVIELSLPWFNYLVDRTLQFAFFSWQGGLLMLLSLSVSLLAGIYPALYLSRLSPKVMLQGDTSASGGAVWLRKVLLVSQFVIATALIVGAITLPQQLSFLQTLSPGYDAENRLYIRALPKNEVLSGPHSPLLDAIEKIAGVKQVGPLDTDLTHDIQYSFKPTLPNGEVSPESIAGIGVGFNAVSQLGLTLVAGRDFTPQFASDWYVRKDGEASVSVIVTESVTKLAGFDTPDQMIGQSMQRGTMTMTVVGVVKELQIGNAKRNKTMAMFLPGYSLVPTAAIVVEVEKSQQQFVTQQLTQLLASRLGIYEPEIEDIGANFSANFNEDSRFIHIIQAFSLLVLGLAMLGVVGLTSFTMLKRQKEVAVRKVLGASRISIANLLAKEFLLLVVIGILIAFPLAYWLVGDWLANFNDRIEQALWVYGVAAISVALVTWLTVAILIVKTTRTRPASILRYE